MFDKFIVEITDDGKIRLRRFYVWGGEADAIEHTIEEARYWVKVWTYNSSPNNDLIVKEFNSAIDLLDS